MVAEILDIHNNFFYGGFIAKKKAARVGRPS